MTIRILAALAAVFCFTGQIQGKAQASELDRESQVVNEQAARAKDLPGTVVVRVNERTGEASVLELGERLEAGADSARLVADMAGFKAVPASGVQSPAGELDRNSSSSSWYAWYNYNYYYAPTYYYWGYTYSYRTYYSYNWYGYAYYWYRWY